MKRKLLLLASFVSMVIAQSSNNQFDGCDYYQSIQSMELNRVYEIFSPRYPQDYLPGTYCRWSACAPYNTVIVVNCSIMQIPSSQYCVSDRLEVSLAGCQDLNDGATYCSNTPFVSVTKSNALVMALKTASNSPGGSFLCKIQARQNAIPVSQIRYPTTPVNTYPLRVLPQSPPIQRPTYQQYRPTVYYSSTSRPIITEPNRGNVYPNYNSNYRPNGMQPFPTQPYGTPLPTYAPPPYAPTTQGFPTPYTPSPTQGFPPPYTPSPTQGYPPPYTTSPNQGFPPLYTPSSTSGFRPMFQPSPIQQVMGPTFPQAFQPTYQQQGGYQPAYRPSDTYPLQRPQPFRPQYQRPYYPTQQQAYPGGMLRPVYQPMAAHSEYPPQCQCGLRKTPRIVGGVSTDVNEFPFVCGIMDLTTKRVICGCTIIHEQYVITSAHCVVNQSLSDIGCLVGAQDYAMQTTSPYTSIYRFAGFIPYPSYDPISLVNDIAIMRIYGPMQFNPGVSAVCLPISDRLNQNTFVYSQAEAAGWGQVSYGGPTSTNLKKVELTVIPNDECNKNYPYQISTAQMCTFTPHKDICEFDDGGGLLFTDTLSGRSVLIGAFSYGVACASRMARVLSRMTNYLSWILQTTNGTATFCVI